MTVKKTAEPVKAPVKKAPVKAPVARVKKAPPAKPLSRLDAVTAREFAYFMIASMAQDVKDLKQHTFHSADYISGYETEGINFFRAAIRDGELEMDDELLEFVREVARLTGEELAADAA